VKLAYFGPLPPLRSAMAEFGRELLPTLANYAEIDVWVDGTQPLPLDVAGFRVVQYRRGDPKLLRLTLYGARLYQMTDEAPSRTPLHDVACRYPGVVVLHESAEVHTGGEHPLEVDADARALIGQVLSVASGLIVRDEEVAARVRDLCAGLPIATIPGCDAREYARFAERVSGGIEPLRLTLVERVVAEMASMGAMELDTFLIEEFGDALDRTLGDG
jgi:hypothetical protein